MLARTLRKSLWRLMLSGRTIPRQTLNRKGPRPMIQRDTLLAVITCCAALAAFASRLGQDEKRGHAPDRMAQYLECVDESNRNRVVSDVLGTCLPTAQDNQDDALRTAWAQYLGCVNKGTFGAKSLTDAVTLLAARIGPETAAVADSLVEAYADVLLRESRALTTVQRELERRDLVGTSAVSCPD